MDRGCAIGVRCARFSILVARFTGIMRELESRLHDFVFGVHVSSCVRYSLLDIQKMTFIHCLFKDQQPHLGRVHGGAVGFIKSFNFQSMAVGVESSGYPALRCLAIQPCFQKTRNMAVRNTRKKAVYVHPSPLMRSPGKKARVRTSNGIIPR